MEKQFSIVEVASVLFEKMKSQDDPKVVLEFASMIEKLLRIVICI